jgi:hypothetical protein
LRVASLKNPARLFHLSARHLRNRLRMAPVRECCHLAVSAFTGPDAGRAIPSVNSARLVGRLLRPLQRAPFLCRISASLARSRMHCREGMHLFLVQGGFLGQPKTDRPHDSAPGWEHAHFPLPSELWLACRVGFPLPFFTRCIGSAILAVRSAGESRLRNLPLTNRTLRFLFFPGPDGSAVTLRLLLSPS